jgi:hypothetical protein
MGVHPAFRPTEKPRTMADLAKPPLENEGTVRYGGPSNNDEFRRGNIRQRCQSLSPEQIAAVRRELDSTMASPAPAPRGEITAFEAMEKPG